MSSLSSPLPTVPPSPSAPPIAVVFYGQLDDMLINAIFIGALIPICIALVMTSSHLWRRPIFILNICSIVCGFAYGAVTIVNTREALGGRPSSVQRIQAITCLSFLVPICTQSILLVRIIAVYPPRMLPWTKILLVYGVVGAMLVARLINMGIALSEFIHAMSTSADPFVAWQIPSIRVDLFLGLFYDMYASALFLVRLGRGTAAVKGRIGTTVPYPTGEPRVRTYADRLRGLFWIAVSNFVFPSLINIAVIVVVFRTTDYFLAADLVCINMYVVIISVLLATIWCSGKYWDRNGTETMVVKPEAVELGGSTTPCPERLFPSHNHSESSIQVYGVQVGKE